MTKEELELKEKTIKWLSEHFKTNCFGETISYDFKTKEEMFESYKNIE